MKEKSFCGAENLVPKKCLAPCDTIVALGVLGKSAATCCDAGPSVAALRKTREVWKCRPVVAGLTSLNNLQSTKSSAMLISGAIDSGSVAYHFIATYIRTPVGDSRRRGGSTAFLGRQVCMDPQILIQDAQNQLFSGLLSDHPATVHVVVAS